jgi:hypothetical protein
MLNFKLGNFGFVIRYSLMVNSNNESTNNENNSVTFLGIISVHSWKQKAREILHGGFNFG